MRRLTILLLILLAASYYAFRFFQTLPVKTGSDRSDPAQKIENARTSVTYILDKTKWTEFSLTPASNIVKILSNAVLPSDMETSPADRIWYAFEYRILNSQKEVIAHRKYHHHTRLTLFSNEETGSEEPSSFFMDPEIVPADLRSTLIDLDKLENPRFISLRLFRKDSGVMDVVARVYCEETVAERKIAYMWHRLSDEQKRLMARGNVYPPDFLTESEKRNLLEVIWRPLGPAGMENQDYRVRRLYVLREMEGDRIGPSVFPRGLLIDKFHYGIIPVPESGGHIRLQMTGLDHSKTPGARITVKWYGRKAHERYFETIPWTRKKSYEKYFKGGLLEIKTDRDMVVRAFLGKGENRTEITPEPLYVRTYLISAGRPVVYSVDHVKNLATPFRFDFRTFCLQSEQKERPSPATIKYVLTGKSGRTVKTGTIRINPEISRYDRFSGDFTGFLVSDAEQRFFNLPPNVQKISFTSNQTALISGYNRPPDIVKQTRAPEDYYKYHLKDEKRLPTWFSLRPLDYYDLIPADRTRLLVVQYRPPEDKPDYLAGRYAWESFLPEGDWRGRYLFVPVDSDKPVAEDSYNIIYRPVPANTGLDVTFRHSVKRIRSIRPKLFFERPSAEPEPFKFFMDGGILFETKISGRRGEMDLPAISAGAHRIRISGPEDTKWLMSNAGPGERPVVKRFARHLDHGGLKFVYDKQSAGPETLMAHFFSPFDQTYRSVVNVHIASENSGGIGPHLENTLTNRKFSITPDRTDPVPVLHTQTEYVDHGRVFYLPLGSDLPPGKYRITFSLEKGSEGYIIFSKITPGEFEKRRFYNEETIDFQPLQF